MIKYLICLLTLISTTANADNFVRYYRGDNGISFYVDMLRITRNKNITKYWHKSVFGKSSIVSLREMDCAAMQSRYLHTDLHDESHKVIASKKITRKWELVAPDSIEGLEKEVVCNPHI